MPVPFDCRTRLPEFELIEPAKVDDAAPETVRVPVAVMLAAVRLPAKYPFPLTSRGFDGVEVPIPMFPLARIIKRDAPLDEATVRRFVVAADDVPCMLKVDVGDVVPIPTNPWKYADMALACVLEATETDNGPDEKMPPAPTFRPPPTCNWPCAMMSFVTCKFPACNDPTFAVLNSPPPRSKVTRELLP